VFTVHPLLPLFLPSARHPYPSIPPLARASEALDHWTWYPHAWRSTPTSSSKALPLSPPPTASANRTPLRLLRHRTVVWTTPTPSAHTFCPEALRQRGPDHAQIQGLVMLTKRIAGSNRLGSHAEHQPPLLLRRLHSYLADRLLRVDQPRR